MSIQKQPSRTWSRHHPEPRPEPPDNAIRYRDQAERICGTFRLRPMFEVLERVRRADLVACTVRCVLTHFPTGQAWAEGLGAANSRERSLRWRSVPEQDLRPEDRRRAVRTEERIDPDGRRRRVCYLANDPWDLDNCVVKSACRRALIAAAQTVFGGGFDRSDRPGPGKSEGEGWAHDR